MNEQSKTSRFIGKYKNIFVLLLLIMVFILIISGTTTITDYKITVQGAHITGNANITGNLNVTTNILASKIGIGTQSPGAKLDVRGAIRATDWTNISGLGSSNINDIYLLNTGDTATGNYNFDSGTFFIDSSGDMVGIGTSSPKQTLNVIGTFNVSNLTQVVSGTLGLFQNNKALVGIGTSNPKQTLNVIGTFNVTGLSYFGSNVSFDSGTLFISADGNKVGIGIATPSQKLDVNGAIQFGDATLAEAGVIRWNGVQFQGYNGTSWNSFASAGAGSLWGQSGSNLYYTAGSVGIGTANPKNPLNVIGAINATGQVYSNGLVVLTSYTETDPKWSANISNYYTKALDPWSANRTSYYTKTQVDNNLTTRYYLRTNPFGYYNSSSTITEHDPKWSANISSYYTKLLDPWSANRTSYYTKLLDPWSANRTSYYTKTQTDNNLTTRYVPYTGASSNVVLGAKNLTLTGRLGISTTTPKSSLDVRGAIRATDWTNITGLIDSQISDTLTIDGTGTVTWAALTTYPTACVTNKTITTMGDTITCSDISIKESQISNLQSYVTSVTGTAPIASSGGTTPAISLTLLKDIVAGSGLTGGADNVLPGADEDITLTIGTGKGITVNADDVAVAFGTSFLGWQNLTNYPTACATNKTITTMGDTITCSDISIKESQISNLQSYYLKSNPFGFYNSSTLTEHDPKWSANRTSYYTKLLDPWSANRTSYYTITQINNLGYYNSSDFSIANYYLKSNPFGFWNSTKATFNKTYADTLYSTKAEPLWSGNRTLIYTKTQVDNNLTTRFYSRTQINTLDYYNSSDFVITNYYLKSNPFSFYNSSTFPDNYLLNTGDTATGNYTFDTPTFHIGSTANRVGIGTVRPKNTLNVLGDANVTGIFYGTNTTGSGASEFIIDSKGNIGVGSASPVSRVHIDGGLAAAAGTSGSSFNSILRLEAKASNVGVDFGLVTTGTPYTWIQPRLTSNYTTNYNLVLNPNGGNVGIGASNPKNKLNVIGAGNFTTNSFFGQNITVTKCILFGAGGRICSV